MRRCPQRSKLTPTLSPHTVLFRSLSLGHRAFTQESTMFDAKRLLDQFLGAGGGAGGGAAGAPGKSLDLGGMLSGRTTGGVTRSEEHTSELQSLMRISYAVFCLKKKKKHKTKLYS